MGQDVGKIADIKSAGRKTAGTSRRPARLALPPDATSPAPSDIGDLIEEMGERFARDPLKSFERSDSMCIATASTPRVPKKSSRVT